VLDATADALFVTAGIEPPKKNAKRTDVLGTIGSQLVRRIGSEAAEEFGDQLDLPVLPRTAQVVDLEPDSGVAFRCVVVLGALSHLDSQHKATMAAALAEGLRLARANAVKSVALSRPRGGWRLGVADAVIALVDACDQHPDLEVTMYCPTPEEAAEVAGLLRTLGVR